MPTKPPCVCIISKHIFDLRRKGEGCFEFRHVTRLHLLCQTHAHDDQGNSFLLMMQLKMPDRFICQGWRLTWTMTSERGCTREREAAITPQSTSCCNQVSYKKFKLNIKIYEHSRTFGDMGKQNLGYKEKHKLDSKQISDWAVGSHSLEFLPKIVDYKAF